MSIQVMSAVWRDAPVAGGELLVLLAMADHANENGICWPSIATLAKKARLSERQVQRVIKDLVEAGLVVLDRGTGPNGVNTYKVLVRGDKMTPLKSRRGGDIEAGGGDMGVTGGVTLASPKPSLEPSYIEPSSGNDPTNFLERRYKRAKA